MGTPEALSGGIWARLREPEPKARMIDAVAIALCSFAREMSLVICHLQPA